MKKHALVGLAVLFVCVSLFGQGAIPLPQASPAAAVGQTIGITDVNITYHRPAVNKRKIFGGLVSYDTPWRTGANENTTISFSTPVKIEGQALPAGTYALYAIPTASQWTIIFSKFTGDWGVYNYDPSEDALRVNVTPQAVTDSQERLLYTFDDVTNNSANASLRWEKLRVPVKIEVDLTSTIRSSTSSILRGGKHWDAPAWAAAARWELRNGDVDTALKYANTALDLGITTTTLRTKAAVLEKKGDVKGATELRDRAKTIAVEPEVINLAYGPLIGAKKYDEAITWLNGYLAAHPNTNQTWRVYAGIGEAYAAKGDQAKAKEFFDKAMAAAHDMAEKTEVWDSINAAAAEVK
jgi:tetratricopeptide (TPR) repeat protein